MRTIRRWLRATGGSQPIAWTFLPTPLSRDAIADIDPELVVYFCVDDLPSSSPGARRVGQSEAELFRSADLVLVTSERLSRRALRYRNPGPHVPLRCRLPPVRARATVRCVPAARDPGPAPPPGLVPGGREPQGGPGSPGGGRAATAGRELRSGRADRDGCLHSPTMPERPALGATTARAGAGLSQGVRRGGGALPSHRLHGGRLSGQAQRVPGDGIAGGGNRPGRYSRFNAVHCSVVRVASDEGTFAAAVREAAGSTSSASNVARRLAVAQQND